MALVIGIGIGIPFFDALVVAATGAPGIPANAWVDEGGLEWVDGSAVDWTSS